MKVYEAILPNDKKDINDISSEGYEKLTWRILQAPEVVNAPIVLRDRSDKTLEELLSEVD